MEPTYSIAELASRTGLSYDTIRYYEKIGLLPRAKRKENGQRVYDKLDLDRVYFITRLKRTHMPLKEIERYMKQAAARDFESCYNVLQEHRRSVESQMAELQATLELMDYKIGHFKEMMKHSGIAEEQGAPVRS